MMPTSTTESTVVTEMEIHSTPDKIFAAITDPEQLSQWWEGADHWEIDLKPGGKWRGWGMCNGKVSQVEGEFVEITSPSTLIYTWVSDRRGEPATQVRWDLQEQGRSTLITITHSGFRKQDSQAMKGYAAGWTDVTRSLRSFLYETANETFAAKKDAQKDSDNQDLQHDDSRDFNQDVK